MISRALGVRIMSMGCLHLQAFPAFDLHFGTNFSTGGQLITFSTRSWNKGAGPMELVVGETSGNKTTIHIMDTNKVDTSLPGGVCVGSGIKFNSFTVVR